MATESTNEMYLELADSTGEYTRILRVPNPNSSTYTTKASVLSAIEGSFFPLAEGSAEIIPFFFDDSDKTKGLTQLKSVQIVRIQKSVTELT